VGSSLKVWCRATLGASSTCYPGERGRLPAKSRSLRSGGNHVGDGCVALPANFVVRPVGVPFEAQKTVNEAHPT
jgi:hypothetical protein